MNFLTFLHQGEPHAGLVIEGKVLDLASVPGLEHGPGMSLEQLIVAGEPALELVRRAQAKMLASSLDGLVDLANVTVLAPIPRPRKNVFCVGRNYKEHVEEAARARGAQVQLPEYVQFFSKPPTTVIGPYDDIPWESSLTQQLDYEVELGIVIGRKGKNISRDDALSHIFGYTVINDITARDLQKRHGQWFKGKSLDGSCPMGPFIVHASAIPDPQALEVRLTVNGEIRQQAPTSMMIFDVREIIHQLSAGLTLEPGDIIATGTPSGVGFAMTPSGVLKDGDIVVAEVPGVGLLRNRVSQVDA